MKRIIVKSEFDIETIRRALHHVAWGGFQKECQFNGEYYSARRAFEFIESISKCVLHMYTCCFCKYFFQAGEYDFVFDVQLGDDDIPENRAKLPFNKSEYLLKKCHE